MARKPQITSVRPAGVDSIAADANPAADPAGNVTLVVQGPAAGRWRIGRFFGPEPVSIPASDLTEAQARSLNDDPMLAIHIVGLPS